MAAANLIRESRLWTVSFAVLVTFRINPANVLFFQFSKPVMRQISLSLLHFDWLVFDNAWVEENTFHTKRFIYWRRIDGKTLNCEVDSWCFGELEQPILWFKFAQINVLVTANREDDRLNTKSKDCNVEFDVINRYQDKQRLPVEIHIVDTAHVPRQLVNQLLTVHIPNVHVPGWQT